MIRELTHHTSAEVIELSTANYREKLAGSNESIIQSASTWLEATREVFLVSWSDTKAGRTPRNAHVAGFNIGSMKDEQAFDNSGNYIGEFRSLPSEQRIDLATGQKDCIHRVILAVDKTFAHYLATQPLGDMFESTN